MWITCKSVNFGAEPAVCPYPASRVGSFRGLPTSRCHGLCNGELVPPVRNGRLNLTVQVVSAPSSFAAPGAWHGKRGVVEHIDHGGDDSISTGFCA